MVQDKNRYIVIGAALGAILGAIGGLIYLRAFSEKTSDSSESKLGWSQIGRLAMVVLSAVRQIFSLG